jgi:hypothetical protein
MCVSEHARLCVRRVRKLAFARRLGNKRNPWTAQEFTLHHEDRTNCRSIPPERSYSSGYISGRYASHVLGTLMRISSSWRRSADGCSFPNHMGGRADVDARAESTVHRSRDERDDSHAHNEPGRTQCFCFVRVNAPAQRNSNKEFRAKNSNEFAEQNLGRISAHVPSWHEADITVALMNFRC